MTADNQVGTWYIDEGSSVAGTWTTDNDSGTWSYTDGDSSYGAGSWENYAGTSQGTFANDNADYTVKVDSTGSDETGTTTEYVATTVGEDCGYSDNLGYWVECADGLTCEQQDTASSSGSYHICVAGEEDDEQEQWYAAEYEECGYYDDVLGYDITCQEGLTCQDY